MEPKFCISTIFGSVQIMEDRKLEDGKLFLGGHCIHRDMNGIITKVTEPEYYISMTC